MAGISKFHMLIIPVFFIYFFSAWWEWGIFFKSRLQASSKICLARPCHKTASRTSSLLFVTMIKSFTTSFQRESDSDVKWNRTLANSPIVQSRFANALSWATHFAPRERWRNGEKIGKACSLKGGAEFSSGKRTNEEELVGVDPHWQCGGERIVKGRVWRIDCDRIWNLRGRGSFQSANGIVVGWAAGVSRKCAPLRVAGGRKK